jgi:hypothetical protein
MDKTDIAILNTADDESLNDYFQQKEPGEDCTITVSGKFLGLEEGNARISIEGVELEAIPEAEEPAPEMYEDDEPSGAELVLGKK